MRGRMRANGSSVITEHGRPQFAHSRYIMRLARKTSEIDSTPVEVVTPTSEDHAEHALDVALAESFPSSDPVAVSIPKPSDTPLTKDER